jgi:hypothetical protein
MKLKSLAYTSRARLDLTNEDLHEIHRTARELNALDGITGLLAFDGSRFLQIIEGAEEGVDHLVARLRADRRHLAFEIREERFVDSRSFPDWSMELVLVSAGYLGARDEIGTKLPSSVSADVRDVALRMAKELSRAP